MDAFGPRLTIYGGVEPRLSLTLAKNENTAKTALELIAAME